jgi:hypothetical protein
VPRAGFEGDLNNWAPRFGVAWRPRGSADTVIRAGYGVFHDVTTLVANSGMYFNPPFFELRVFAPSAERLLTLSDPFPAAAGFAPPASVNTMQPDFRTPYMQHWNLSVERVLPRRLVLRSAYVGSSGTKLLSRRDLNQPAPGPGDVDSHRPIPGVAHVALFESAANSSYHSAQLSLDRRFGGSLTFSSAFTWAKSIDNASAFLNTAGDQSFPQNSHNLAAERGLSAFDQRRRLVFALHWSPAGPHNVLLRGWSLQAIGAFQSGRPFTPQLNFDNSNSGNIGGTFGADRPNVSGDPTLGNATPERFFNTAAFSTPAPFQFGNSGRNVLTGPGSSTIDVAAVRRFAFGETVKLSLRAEAFNLANHANFDLPRRTVGEPDFGRVTSSGPSRQVQLGLRLEF